ncbi:MAG: hypothetical protein WDN49_17870 [Acetobacteraceae bacterium]
MASSTLAVGVVETQADGWAEDRALRLTGVLLFATLFLQRFALPVGPDGISIVGPIGLMIVAGGVLQGTLALHRARLVLYLLFVVGTLLGLAWHAGSWGQMEYASNLPSIGQFLLLSSFAIVTFAQPVDEARFFRLVNFYLMLIGAAGILQFLAQFAGLGLFSFTGLLPSSILFETMYNLQIPIGVGSLLKSNGFFLVEPSVLSQMMAVALIIEVLAFRRLSYLAVFTVALLLSFSGTGWIVIGAFLVGAVLSLGWRGLFLAVATLCVLGLVALGASFVAPDLALAVAGRFGEFTQPGTSGHLRFVTPYWLLSDVLDADPVRALVGLGGGVSEKLTMPYEYNVNTPVKIAIEYGFPVLVVYLLLFLVGRRTAVQGALVFPAMVLFLFTGGYQQFPPILFFILLLIAVAWLRPSDAAAR